MRPLAQVETDEVCPEEVCDARQLRGCGASVVVSVGQPKRQLIIGQMSELRSQINLFFGR